MSGNMRRAFAAVLLAALSTVAAAQEPAVAGAAVEPPAPAAADATRTAQDARQAFRAFVQPFLGEWRCRMRAWEDPSHERTREWVQTHRFEWILRRTFVQETITAPMTAGDKAVVAINMISVDPETSHVLVSTFRYGDADRAQAWDGELAPNLRQLSGSILVRGAVGAQRQKRVLMKWTDDDRWMKRIYARTYTNWEFMEEEAICTKSTAEAAEPAAE
jgi:hypothetical protein